MYIIHNYVMIQYINKLYIIIQYIINKVFIKTEYKVRFMFIVGIIFIANTTIYIVCCILRI